MCENCLGVCIVRLLFMYFQFLINAFFSLVFFADAHSLHRFILNFIANICKIKSHFSHLHFFPMLSPCNFFNHILKNLTMYHAILQTKKGEKKEGPKNAVT